MADSTAPAISRLPAGPESIDTFILWLTGAIVFYTVNILNRSHLQFIFPLNRFDKSHAGSLHDAVCHINEPCQLFLRSTLLQEPLIHRGKSQYLKMVRPTFDAVSHVIDISFPEMTGFGKKIATITCGKYLKTR